MLECDGTLSRAGVDRVAGWVGVGRRGGGGGGVGGERGLGGCRGGEMAFSLWGCVGGIFVPGWFLRGVFFLSLSNGCVFTSYLVSSVCAFTCWHTEPDIDSV